MKPSELLKQVGWCKKRYESCDGSICLSEALGRCAVTEARPKVREKFIELFPERASTTIGFNDHPSTTFNDVIQVLEAVGL